MQIVIASLLLCCLAVSLKTCSSAPAEAGELQAAAREAHHADSTMHSKEGLLKREMNPILLWQAAELRALGFAPRFHHRDMRRTRRSSNKLRRVTGQLSPQGESVPFCTRFGCNCTKPPNKPCCDGYKFDKRSKTCKKANG